ncbi:MAG TPA: hypothetical protein VKB52_13155, partial [Rhodanobacteraceae bacterium]|nr:hypothetical protein [Rhodanobacteraceae bacterium]
MRAWLLLVLIGVCFFPPLQGPVFADESHASAAYAAVLKFTADGVSKPTATIKGKFGAGLELNFEEKRSASGWSLRITVDSPAMASDGRMTFPTKVQIYEVVD